MDSLRSSLLAFFLVANFDSLSWAAVQSGSAIEMKVRTVAVDPASGSPVVVLEGVAAKEYLPIWIDLPEARAITMEIEQIKPPRPLTHDLIRNLLNGLGATVKRVTVTDLRNNTYFATIAMSLKGQEAEIDSRPSDAIAIALRMKAPIFVTAKVLETSQAQSEATARADHAEQRLGMRVQELTAELAKLMDSQVNRGVIVTDVIGGGAALKAGIQRGDIISKLNDQAVSTLAAFQANIQSLSKSARVNLEIIRKGKSMMIVIDLP
jgi:bifunctional DNase/RNase